MAFCPALATASSDEFDEQLTTDSSVLSVDALTPSEFASLSALAPTLLGATASGNITNDVAAILDLLNDQYTRYGFRVVPMVASDSSFTLARYLLSLMYENGTTAGMGSALTLSRSYLYEIQRALYGQTGVPSQGEAIQPLLARIAAASSLDQNWTNLLVDDYGQSLLLYPYEVADDIMSSGLNWYDVAEFFCSAQGAPGTWANLWNAVYWGVYDLHDVWIEDATDASASQSALRVVDANAASYLDQILITLQDFEYGVSGGLNQIDQTLTDTNLPPDSPSVPDYSDDISGSEEAARQVESEAATTLSNLSTNEVPSWEYTRDIPGSDSSAVSVLDHARPSYAGSDSFNTSEAGIPLIAAAIVAPSSLGGVTLPDYVIETSANPGYASYVSGWRSRFDAITSAIWRLVAAFCVFMILRREWLYYMGVGSQQVSDAETHAAEMEVF